MRFWLSSSLHRFQYLVIITKNLLWIFLVLYPFLSYTFCLKPYAVFLYCVWNSSRSLNGKCLCLIILNQFLISLLSKYKLYSCFFPRYTIYFTSNFSIIWSYQHHCWKVATTITKNSEVRKLFSYYRIHCIIFHSFSSLKITRSEYCLFYLHLYHILFIQSHTLYIFYWVLEQFKVTEW